MKAVAQLCGLPALCIMLACVSQPVLAEAPKLIAEEFREFEIFIKDHPSGTSVVHIRQTDDGKTTVQTEARATYRVLLYVYRYELHGQEVWAGDRLAAIDNRANDDGQALTVHAMVGPADSLIDANGKSQRTPRSVDFTTSYWRLPTNAQASIQLGIDADRGTLYRVRFERVGTEQVNVAGNRIQCEHFRVKGDVSADLWFDRQNRLVQQRTIEEGYPTELRLARITTKAPDVARR